MENMSDVKMRPLGVFVATANKAENAALRLVFEQQDGVSVVGDAKNTHDVLEKIGDSGADLLLLDWELPGQSEIINNGSKNPPELAVPDLIASLRLEMDRLHIVALSIEPDNEQVALAAGADVFVCKAGPPEKMLADLIIQTGNL